MESRPWRRAGLGGPAMESRPAMEEGRPWRKAGLGVPALEGRLSIWPAIGRLTFGPATGQPIIWPAAGRLNLGPAIGLGRPKAEARFRHSRPCTGRVGRSDALVPVGPRWTDNISPPSFWSSVGRPETQCLR